MIPERQHGMRHVCGVMDGLLQDELYDPDADDEDATWVQTHLRHGIPRTSDEPPPDDEPPDANQEAQEEEAERQDNAMAEDENGDRDETMASVFEEHRERLPWKLAQKARREAASASDGVLNCMGCFTPLCYQSQRHEKYAHQYRAIEAVHCRIDPSHILNPASLTLKPRAPPGHPDSGQEDDPVSPVFCAECGTLVGAHDDEGIYHFFQVIASDG